MPPREERRSAYQRGYTKRWEKEARAFKARYPLCGMRQGGWPPVMSRCHLERRTTPADVVDHVEPHRGDMALFWDTHNWQSLCATCHNSKTKAGL